MKAIPFKNTIIQYITVSDLISELSKYDGSIPVILCNEPMSLNEVSLNEYYYPGDSSSPSYDSKYEMKVIEIGW